MTEPHLQFVANGDRVCFYGDQVIRSSCVDLCAVADDDNRSLVGELRRLGLNLVADEGDRPKEGRLTGSQYAVTGTLESMTREQAQAALEELGAKVSDNVSKKTTGVFVGESPGSKVAKAEKAGVPLLGEADLLALVGS